MLSRLWSVGAAVPYPVQLLGTQLMMEFIGDPMASPRHAWSNCDPERDEAADLFGQLRDVLCRLADAGYTHGDLSPYNVLVHDGRLVLIDLPQAVDLVGNPQGFDVPAPRLRQHLHLVPGPRRRRPTRRHCSTT